MPKSPPASREVRTSSSKKTHRKKSNATNETRISRDSSSSPSDSEREAVLPTPSRQSTTGPVEEAPRDYSVKELMAALGHETETSHFSPELELRVRDFHLAQRKRREKHGEQQRCGIYGMYAHLSNCRVDLEWAEDAAYRRAHNLPYLSWSDFDDARQRGRNQPWFVYAVISFCTLMLVVVFGVNDWRVEPPDVNPLIGPSAEALIKAGARETSRIVDEGQWFRIFTPIVLHAGLVHYAINMIALYFIGGAIEHTHGVFHAVVLFAVPGVGGNIFSAIFLPQYISVGASGAIFGMIGGCLADLTVNWKLLFIKERPDDDRSKQNIRAILWLVLDIVVNILLGLTPFIDNFTHLGGLLYGLCCGWSTIKAISFEMFSVKEGSLAKIKKTALRYLGVILSVVFILFTTIWLATRDVGENPCQGCRYISCVPFPLWECDDCRFVTAEIFDTDDDFKYDYMSLTCPNSVVERIDIRDRGYFVDQQSEIQDELPSYCRQYCDEVYRS